MAIIFGDRNNNTIAAAAAGTTIFGMSGADTLSSAFETADLRGGWGADVLTVGREYQGSLEGAGSPLRWALSGDQGDDDIGVSYDLRYTSAQIGNYSPTEISIIIEGGAGNDTVAIQGIGHGGNATSNFYSEVAVVDTEGNNQVFLNIFSVVGDIGVGPVGKASVFLGDGNDYVSVKNYLQNSANNSSSSVDISLGNGNNVFLWNESSGVVNADVNSGYGNDIFDVKVIQLYNEERMNASLNFFTDGGADVVKIVADSTHYEFDFFDLGVNLGSGKNEFDFLSVGRGGAFHIDVISGNDNDRVSIDFSNSEYLYGLFCNIDLGDGNNVLLFDRESSYAESSSVMLVAGFGTDIITLVGGSGTYISSGGGSDTITAGSGADTISGGTGGDSLTVAKSIFDASEFTDAQTLTLTDFSLADLDRLTLTGFTLAGSLADGILNTAADFVALKTPGGDVLSFVQTGTDALLTLNLGAGETGKILFQNFTIPVLDAPRSFVGTSANNVFVGGNNADQFFLKLGQDRATGNGGADLFRVNAVTNHNTNGDRHTITDLNFAEGDVLRFDNFGPSWANNAVNPANDLQYVAGTFNNWIVNSLADLRELRDSGAVMVSAITGGSSILFEDQAGDDMRIDLLGVFI